MDTFLSGIHYILTGAHWDLTDSQSIPSLLGDHLYITVLTLAISLVIAFPVSLLVVRYTRLNLPVQTVASLLYTIPSLALFGYMILITGLSVFTIVIPLVLYAQVVLIRNIVAAIRAVDPALVEVGRAMGMNGAQLQYRVILPLALPVIVAGIRIVTVTTIGIATLAPYFGTDDLGTLIYQGINFQRTNELMAGSILVTALAIALDLSLLGIQRLLGRGTLVAAGA